MQNSPASRVPSHGTDLFGTRYAIDFVAVDTRGRTAGSLSWRSALAAERPELFFAFGEEVLTPGAGTVRVIHDGEEDHAARRSQLSLFRYMLGQPGRVRRGPAAIAGNHVILEDPPSGCFIALVHVRRGSIRVQPGEQVTAGQAIAQCGNSGNSTQPHLHLQAMDSLDLRRAQGVPVTFRGFRDRPRRGAETVVSLGLPANASIIQPIQRRQPDQPDQPGQP